MLLLYLLLYQAKELRNAVPEGHVAGLGGYVNYRGNTVIVVVMVMAGYPRYIRRRRSCRLGFLAGSRALAGIGFAHTAYRVVFLLIFMLSPP